MRELADATGRPAGGAALWQRGSRGASARAAGASSYRADLSYLGTYAEDRQAALERLFVEPARQMPRSALCHRRRASTPTDFPVDAEHLFRAPLASRGASGLLLLLAADAECHSRGDGGDGLLPSGRLFEAAACGVPILSDWWDGLEEFFEPGREILHRARTRPRASPRWSCAMPN